MPTPLLIISDAPSGPSGLARITRDLAVRIHKHLPEVFRVATYGYGGLNSRALPFQQYTIEQMNDWVLPALPEVWNDFAGKEHGKIMSIWDASRMLWFSRPENCQAPYLRHFLNEVDAEKWGYFPMDAVGPHGRLTTSLCHIIDNYDRVLGYSKWAYDILTRSLNSYELDLDWRPHGIDTSVFQPRNKTVARHGFGERINARTLKGKFLAVPDDALMVGIVATNQIRKDYGLGIQTVAELAKKRRVMLWIHIDALDRHWSMRNLIEDFGFTHDNCVVTLAEMSDEKMSWCYSACDVTLGIGGAEGYGYPIFESLACGVPCIHGHDGGAPEHMPPEMLVQPAAKRLEGLYNSYRNVYDPVAWAYAVEKLPKKTGRSLLPPHLDWNNLWPSWAEWLTKGVKQHGQKESLVLSSVRP